MLCLFVCMLDVEYTSRVRKSQILPYAWHSMSTPTATQDPRLTFNIWRLAKVTIYEESYDNNRMNHSKWLQFCKICICILRHPILFLNGGNDSFPFMIYFIKLSILLDFFCWICRILYQNFLKIGWHVLCVYTADVIWYTVDLNVDIADTITYSLGREKWVSTYLHLKASSSLFKNVIYSILYFEQEMFIENMCPTSHRKVLIIPQYDNSMQHVIWLIYAYNVVIIWLL